MPVDKNNPSDPTAAAVYRHLEEVEAKEPRRAHLGASAIGHECARRSWYTFRWVTKNKHPGRMVALFRRGKLEEKQRAEDLRAVGVELQTETEDGEQIRAVGFGGHFSGSVDGVGKRWLDDPLAVRVWEVKCINDATWKRMKKHGLKKAHPTYYGQCQVYLRLLNDDGWNASGCHFEAVNKNDDQVYTEIVLPDEEYTDGLLFDAEQIIRADEPPPRISETPEFHVCKMSCGDFRSACQFGDYKALDMNCRTCVSITPRDDGTMHCERHDSVIDVEEQARGCTGHRFHPHLLPRDWEVSETNDLEGWVEYRTPDGIVRNRGGRFEGGGS